MVLFSNQEANFEAEILSPNGWVGSILISFLHKITHNICTNVGYILVLEVGKFPGTVTSSKCV